MSWVRNKREAYGWTRPELSDRCGLTVSKIAGIELGRPFKPGEKDALEAAFETEAKRRPTMAQDGPIDVSPLNNPPDKWTADNPETAEALEQVEEEVFLSRMIRGKRTTKVPPSHVKRVSSWTTDDGLVIEKGDPVKVKATTFNEPGKDNYVRGAFVFVCHAFNTRTSDEWVEVVGGKPGHRLSRNFAGDRIEAIKPKRSRRK